MTISNYTELQAAIADYLNRSDLTSQIRDFITLAESDINAVGVLTNQETTASVTMTIGQAYSSLPTGFLDVVDFYYSATVDDTSEQLEKLTVQQMNGIRVDDSSGMPSCYAISDVILWELKPDAAYAPIMRYFKKWDIANDTTNWLLTNHPAAYLYGALAHAEPFLVNDQRLTTWRALFDKKIIELNTLSGRVRRATLRCEAPLVASGRPNILVGG